MVTGALVLLAIVIGLGLGRVASALDDVARSLREAEERRVMRLNSHEVEEAVRALRGQEK